MQEIIAEDIQTLSWLDAYLLSQRAIDVGRWRFASWREPRNALMPNSYFLMMMMSWILTMKPFKSPIKPRTQEARGSPIIQTMLDVVFEVPSQENGNYLASRKKLPMERFHPRKSLVIAEITHNAEILPAAMFHYGCTCCEIALCAAQSNGKSSDINTMLQNCKT